MIWLTWRQFRPQAIVAVGVTAGVLIRRTVPAMAVTLAVFAAVQVMMPLWARPHLMAPRHVAAAFNPAGRYWAFQAYEAAIFVVLAAGLGACCAVAIRRRAA